MNTEIERYWYAFIEYNSRYIYGILDEHPLIYFFPQNKKSVIVENASTTYIEMDVCYLISVARCMSAYVFLSELTKPLNGMRLHFLRLLVA